MQAQLKKLSDTKVKLTLKGSGETLLAAKNEALAVIAKDIRIQGFRQGKAPLNLVEKQANPQTLQSEFLDRAMNRLYGAALDEHHLHPVAQPEVKIVKFVPFETLEIDAEVEVIGEIKLPDYKKMKLAKKVVKTDAKEVDEVIENLRTRAGEKKDVDRAAKDGDQVWIDFTGADAKTKEPIEGTDSQNYPLTLGSGAFIPGFEANLVGLKANDVKTFTVTFPKDYGAAALQSRKVSFTVTVNKVQEVVLPKVDDAFAASVGPFKTVAELKADIKGQLQHEKETEAERAYADELLTKITEAATVAIPEILIEEQLERLLRNQKQDLVYRGQTWQEFLDSEKLDEDGYRKKLRPDAQLRVKAGLVLAEIAEKEKITVTSQDVDMQVQLLKGRYDDAKMQAELDAPEARRDLASRLMSEKTIDKIVAYAAGNTKTPRATVARTKTA